MKKRIFTEQEINSVCNLYLNGESIRKVAKIVNLYPKAVVKILKYKDLARRQSTYSLDENYFQCIDSPEKAYILGLLYADGSVNAKNFNVRITLQEKDRDILFKINNLIQSDRPLKFISKPNNRCQNYYSLSIANKKLVNNLINLGVVENKTFKIRLINLDNNLIFHFLRGYFDGDGYTYKDKRRKKSGSWALVSNKIFCQQVKSLLKNNDIKSNVYINNNRNKDSAEVRVSGMADIENIYNLLYRDSTIHIERKYLKFKSLVEKP